MYHALFVLRQPLFLNSSLHSHPSLPEISEATCTGSAMPRLMHSRKRLSSFSEYSSSICLYVPDCALCRGSDVLYKEVQILVIFAFLELPYECVGTSLHFFVADAKIHLALRNVDGNGIAVLNKSERAAESSFRRNVTNRKSGGSAGVTSVGNDSAGIVEVRMSLELFLECEACCSESAFESKEAEDYSHARLNIALSEAFNGIFKRIVADRFMLLFKEAGEIKNMDPAADDVQRLVKRIQEYITDNFYTCTNQILRGLGKMYSGGGDFTMNIDSYGGEGTATFIANAIEIYCNNAE